MRVVIEYDNGEVRGQHEIGAVEAAHLLELLSEPTKGNRREGQAAASLVEDLRASSIREISRCQEGEPRMATVGFTLDELSTLSEALESYWFDCAQGEDESLEGRRSAIEALSAKIGQAR